MVAQSQCFSASVLSLCFCFVYANRGETLAGLLKSGLLLMESALWIRMLQQVQISFD
jgi:hypothetical protein